MTMSGRLLTCATAQCRVETYWGTPGVGRCPGCYGIGTLDDVVLTEVQHAQASPGRCTCGWSAPLGTSIMREFDKHLLEVAADGHPHSE